MTKVVVALALVAAGIVFGYQKLRDADPGRVPIPSQVVVPDPPRVDVNVPNPLR